GREAGAASGALFMRVRVFLFLCRAQFSGQSEISYAEEPALGSEHDCILFVAQQCDKPDYDDARSRLAKHGWVNAHIKRAGQFQPESVNSQHWQVFQRNYEECLEVGDSIVWYV
ncbi:MAG TPA: hypothetical protein VF738_08630, partial [Rhodanobacter sp.]